MLSDKIRSRREDEAESQGPGPAAEEDAQGQKEHRKGLGQHHAGQAEEHHSDAQPKDEAVRAPAGDNTENRLHQAKDELHDGDTEADVFIRYAAVLAERYQQDADIGP